MDFSDRIFKIGERVVVKNGYLNYHDESRGFRIVEGLEGFAGTVMAYEDFGNDCPSATGIRFDEYHSSFHSLAGRVDRNYGYWLSQDMLERERPYFVELI